MSKKQALRELVIERLMVAADEIFALIEQAFAVHEEEVRQKWIKPQEPKEVQHKEAGVQIPFVPPEAHLQHTEAEQTQCDSLFLPFSPLKSEENINKQTFLQQDLAQENRQRTTREECGAKEADDSSALPPGHSRNSPSCSDTDDSEDWDTSADKRNQNDAEESDTAKNTDGQKEGSSHKRRKRRKMQHKPNQGGLVIKREREEQLDTCMQIGPIIDAVSFEATAQTSANAASTSWISLLTQPMQSTDPVVLMHKMLAKQDILLQQQEQLFSLLSTSQLPIPECSLNYKDLPIRDHQVLMGMEARLQDQDYRTKLMHKSIINDGEDFVLERCTICCSLYHCPLCPNHKPDKLSRIRIHLQIHKKNAIIFQDKKICRCHLSCRETGHYHCPFCSKTIIKRGDMEGHLSICVQPAAPKQTPPN